MSIDQMHRERLTKVFSFISLLLLVAGSTLFLGMSFLSLKNTPLHSALAKEQSGSVVITKKSNSRIEWQGIAHAPSFDSKSLKKGYAKAGYSEEAFKNALKEAQKGDTLTLSWKKLPLTGRLQFVQIGKSNKVPHLSVGTIVFKVIGLLLAIAGALLFRFGFRLRNNIVSVTNWSLTVRGANQKNSNEKELKEGFKRALRGEFA